MKEDKGRKKGFVGIEKKIRKSDTKNNLQIIYKKFNGYKVLYVESLFMKVGITMKMDRIELIAVREEELHAQIFYSADKTYDVFIFGAHPNHPIKVTSTNKDEAIEKAILRFELKKIGSLEVYLRIGFLFIVI
jgi:hypothetical protein